MQSQYNVVLENTSLFFDVCKNNAEGCANSDGFTTASDLTSTGFPEGTSRNDQTIVIVIASLAGVIVIALIVGILSWKRKHNQTVAKKEEGTLF